MNKDVIYIDVEDDITSIIGKVKDSKEKIVALVPPKRIGVLQSAVNLRLLSRAAKQNEKRLVLISNNSALLALATSAKIPVAKNLQSKPEIPEVAALDVDNGDDVIDGAQLPVGEHAKTVEPEDARDSAVDDLAKASTASAATSKAAPPADGEKPKKAKTKSGLVPNFGKFRKKLVFIIIGAVLLVVFLIWAIFFAPRATVIISARTTETSANPRVTLGQSLSTNVGENTIKSEVRDVKRDVSVDFEATGSKEVGDESKGSVVFQNCESPNAQTVDQGTAVSANGRNYITQKSVRVPGGSGGFSGCSSPGVSDPVSVVAQEIGEEYNTTEGTRFDVAGYDSGNSNSYFRATAESDITGGSKRTVDTVSSGDVQRASEELAKQNTDAMRDELTKEFGDDYIILEDSFNVDRGDPKANPGVDKEVSDGTTPKLTANVTYSMTAVAKSELDTFLSNYFKDNLDNSNEQRVYENGANNAKFTNIDRVDNGVQVNLEATSKVGPQIDDEDVIKRSVGKGYGEIQSDIEAIQGVDDVDIKFWPFWVSSAPNDANRVTVEFNLDESE